MTSVREGIVVYDRELRYRIWNRFMEDITGMPSGRVIGRKALETFPHLQEWEVDKLIERALAGETVCSSDVYYTVPETKRSGWVTGIYSPLVDSKGEIVGVVGMIHEISERKKSEELLVESTEKYQSIFRAATDAIIILDHETGTVIDVNDAACDLYGYTREELLRLRNIDLSAEPDKTTSGLKAEIDKIPIRYHMKKDGAVFPVEISVSYHYHKGRRISTSVIRDITARKESEEALRESENRLRHLSSQLLRAQEEERKRVAVEIHDSIGGALSSVRFSAENLADSVESGSAVHESLQALLSLIRHATDESRRIMADLRPSILDDLGILSTIGWLCRQHQTVYSGISIEKEISVEEDDVPDPLKIVIFRVMQEALNNIGKHSKADSVRLSLVKRENAMELKIQDNGMGFDIDAAPRRRSHEGGLGLTSMRERTELSGGSFAMQSALGKGTAIHASWPCEG
jgi:PAS domain S-box-containing protein